MVHGGTQTENSQNDHLPTFVRRRHDTLMGQKKRGAYLVFFFFRPSLKPAQRCFEPRRREDHDRRLSQANYRSVRFSCFSYFVNYYTTDDNDEEEKTNVRFVSLFESSIIFVRQNPIPPHPKELSSYCLDLHTLEREREREREKEGKDFQSNLLQYI